MINPTTKIIEQIYNTDLIEKKVNVSGGIIFKEQRGEKPALLLIQRAKDDHWPNFFEFPRGKCDNGPNEGLIACLKREVKEESGLDIIPLKLIDKFSYTADEGKRLSTQHNYLCKMKDPNQKVKLSKEHQSYKWITTAGEAEMTVLPEMKRSILKAFEIVDPDTQIVSYPENDFTPDGTIEENTMIKKLSEEIKTNRMSVRDRFGGNPHRGIRQNGRLYHGKSKEAGIKDHEARNKSKFHKGMSDFYDKRSKRLSKKADDLATLYRSESLHEKIKLSEELIDQYIDESAVVTIAAMTAGGIAGAYVGTAIVKKQCKKLYPDDMDKRNKCVKSPIWKRKKL